MKKIREMSLKKFARAFAIVWMLIFIIAMTIANVGIDKTFDILKWIGNTMILFGIAVFGIFMGESMGSDMQKERTIKDEKGRITGGLYQKNLYEYNIFRQAIDEIIIYFPLFYDWYVPQRLESKQINFLVMNDVNPKKAENIVKYCGSDDLWDLKGGAIKKVVDGKEIYIDKLNEHEIEPVEQVLKGHVKLELSGCSYYLQAFAESNQRDILEQGEGYRKARRFNKRSNRVVRLTGGVIISLALGILTVNDFMKGNDTQAWVNLVVRIANMFTALFSGWLSGSNDVKIEANSIENKTDVLKLFKSGFEKKLFPLYDEEMKAKMRFEEQERQKAEAKANVVEPEVATEEEPTKQKEQEQKSTVNLLENKSNQIE